MKMGHKTCHVLAYILYIHVLNTSEKIIGYTEKNRVGQGTTGIFLALCHLHQKCFGIIIHDNLYIPTVS